MSVSSRWRSWLRLRAWKATSATASAVAGLGEFSPARIRAGSTASGMLVATGVGLSPASWVGEDELAALEDLEQRLESELGEVPVGLFGWQRSHHVSVGDLGEGLVAGLGPGLDDRRDRADVRFHGRWGRAGAGVAIGGSHRA